MRYGRAAFAVVLVVGFAASCGSSPSAPSGPSSGESAESLTEKLATAHFRILADRADAATLRAVADGLEAAYPRMTASGILVCAAAFGAAGQQADSGRALASEAKRRAAVVTGIPGFVALWDFVTREPGGAGRFIARVPAGAAGR